MYFGFGDMINSTFILTAFQRHFIILRTEYLDLINLQTMLYPFNVFDPP